MFNAVNDASKSVTIGNIQQPIGTCVRPGDTVMVCSGANNSIAHLAVNFDILGTYPVDMNLLPVYE
ncbi:hypothetical protein DPMN_152584 [Dreissena polymorpha]|uniref:Uncharacterized protein n=1 Tax=Dreissena polymorpha TaxID=45954 RepID=A0A9D4J5A7_DREPO|nr:hypothetical protein DPMN_152584 [Dreissena polymorpha]